jgi:hypothetical protein
VLLADDGARGQAGTCARRNWTPPMARRP